MSTDFPGATSLQPQNEKIFVEDSASYMQKAASLD
eukprot:CAMPEP_0170502624 /NCGR_PEP_ID=MMETSP0208-20121228/42046_1 /TAXON_ID=197538 /ORGANISM="Strombidium inclinatum, Strain S3" /LENGTH=34 /DNA_ID= /DNA_START= /DNA_END= /DNA_ORIENTATION=